MNIAEEKGNTEQSEERSAVIPKLLYTRREAATILSLSIRTIDTLVARKQLRIIRIGKSVRIPLDVLQAFPQRDHRTAKGSAQ